ncbi:hypothetical protein FRC07_004932 [Ceratobasidium sp. 392]|nr:hypothetical protein FRC07_004932 [Ceratobasidium sp. 392]
MVGRAALNALTEGKNTTYFFHGDKYVKIAWTPGAGGDKVQYGPTETWNEWKTLKEAGFTHIDAILPIPGHANRAYFFCGDKYVRTEFTPGTSKEENVGRVHSISEWHSLKKAGFNHVDAALNVPGTTDQAYFFCGNKMARVSFKEGVGSPDELKEGPHMICDHWSGLGFHSIDTIIPHPTSNEHAYVFSGNQACRIVLLPGGGVDRDVGPKDAASYWPSLHQAGFY